MLRTSILQNFRVKNGQPSLLLKLITVKLDQLLLDPNNPAFLGTGEVLNSIPEGRFADDEKYRQNIAMRK